ncbi:hypothetical protein X925_07890 [Petrotoga sp. 9T1HF07.CasAA.8.2]|jgi:hypothetical protein|nr:hypothetical protein X925_07890 [Petrotoga sp. 9T1HF07.CasAA.8.2]PNR90988.1 hypothetical protein X926_09505 [Petrotoga sp. HWHPT.55.6.3]
MGGQRGKGAIYRVFKISKDKNSKILKFKEDLENG